MSGVSGTLPKTRMTDEEEEHVLNLGKRESPVLVPPSINKKIKTLQVSLYIICNLRWAVFQIAMVALAYLIDEFAQVVVGLSLS